MLSSRSGERRQRSNLSQGRDQFDDSGLGYADYQVDEQGYGRSGRGYGRRDDYGRSEQGYGRREEPTRDHKDEGACCSVQKLTSVNVDNDYQVSKRRQRGLSVICSKLSRAFLE